LAEVFLLEFLLTGDIIAEAYVGLGSEAEAPIRISNLEILLQKN
jgi:hypothetical protein